MKYEPYNYQLATENFIINNPSAGLLLDMGMGKTVITLTAADSLLNDYFDVAKCLVIAPLRPATETWPTEAQKWEHLKHLKISTIIGNEKNRYIALNTEADIYITNRENVEWLVNVYRKMWPFDMVIIDELSSFKSAKSNRFKALKKVRPYIKRIVGLTGTPAPNGLLDLWPQMYLLDRGKALGKTFTSYRDTYFEPDRRNASVIYSWRLRTDAQRTIYEKIKPLCISLQSEDYLQLPERLATNHFCDLSPEALATYEQLERDTLLPFANGDIDGKTAAILITKLLQLSGGAAYDENKEVKLIHEDKLKALDDLIETANGQPVLIYYTFKHERDRILERYPRAVEITQNGAISKWNKGEIPIMLAHPASAGHGLNLQFGGNIVIWFSLPFSLELYQQANKRLHRIGQKSVVLIHHILVRETLDAWVLDKVLTNKEANQNALLEALKVKIKEVV